jgi:hypothetical protein
METGKHVKNNVCAVKIKIKWIKRKQMTHENKNRDDTLLIRISKMATPGRLQFSYDLYRPYHS